MLNTLNSIGFLPSSQPYTTSPFNYSGSESVPAGFFQSHTNIVDWVLIEIRTEISSNSTIVRRAGFLLTDGNIVDINGTNPLEFKGNY